jgi:hypothetical protein
MTGHVPDDDIDVLRIKKDTTAYRLPRASTIKYRSIQVPYLGVILPKTLQTHGSKQRVIFVVQIVGVWKKVTTTSQCLKTRLSKFGDS